MDKREKMWFGFLIFVALGFNIFSLSPAIPWQEWLLWSRPAPDKVVTIEMGDYEIRLPAGGIEVQAGDYVEFVATSTDVTYGFGVFRPDGPIVFQMQVIPGYQNRILWKFDQAGSYDIRSTEYSGPKHSQMYIPNAITVRP